MNNDLHKLELKALRKVRYKYVFSLFVQTFTFIALLVILISIISKIFTIQFASSIFIAIWGLGLLFLIFKSLMLRFSIKERAEILDFIYPADNEFGSYLLLKEFDNNSEFLELLKQKCINNISAHSSRNFSSHIFNFKTGINLFITFIGIFLTYSHISSHYITKNNEKRGTIAIRKTMEIAGNMNESILSTEISKLFSDRAIKEKININSSRALKLINSAENIKKAFKPVVQIIQKKSSPSSDGMLSSSLSLQEIALIKSILNRNMPSLSLFPVLKEKGIDFIKNEDEKALKSLYNEIEKINLADLTRLKGKVLYAARENGVKLANNSDIRNAIKYTGSASANIKAFPYSFNVKNNGSLSENSYSGNNTVISDDIYIAENFIEKPYREIIKKYFSVNK